LRQDHAARLRFHNLTRAQAARDFFGKSMTGLFVLAATARSKTHQAKNLNKNRLQA
jgi:hypothetical protein